MSTRDVRLTARQAEVLRFRYDQCFHPKFSDPPTGVTVTKNGALSWAPAADEEIVILVASWVDSNEEWENSDLFPGERAATRQLLRKVEAAVGGGDLP